MANVAEQVGVLLVVGILVFVGMSYAVTGKLISNPAEWFKYLQHPTYQVSFTVSRSPVLGNINIGDVAVNEKTLSIAPKSLRVGPWCPLGYFEGTTIAEVETPQGTVQRVVYDPNLKLCRGDSKPYSEVFVARTSGSYKIDIKVINSRGNTEVKKTVRKYIKVR